MSKIKIMPLIFGLSVWRNMGIALFYSGCVDEVSEYCTFENGGHSDCYRCAVRFSWMREYGPKCGSEAWNQWVFAYDFKTITKFKNSGNEQGGNN